MEPVAVSTSRTKSPQGILHRFLLYCGIFSSFFYVAINIITPMQYPGYSFTAHTVSELSAIGAPSRSLWVMLCSSYSALIIAFGFGIWQSAYNRQLRIVAILMLIYGFSGFFWPPMHQREVIAAGGGTMTDRLHIAFAIGTVVLMILIIGFAAAGLSRRFRLFSSICLVIFAVFGTLTSLDSPHISTNEPTPWIGVWERINIGVFLLWLVVFALVLLSKKDRK